MVLPSQAELCTIPIFAGLDRADLEEIAPLFEREDHAAEGSVICEDGGPGDKFYILLEGGLAVISP